MSLELVPSLSLQSQCRYYRLINQHRYPQTRHRFFAWQLKGADSYTLIKGSFLACEVQHRPHLRGD